MPITDAKRASASRRCSLSCVGANFADIRWQHGSMENVEASMERLQILNTSFFELMPLEIGAEENGWTQGLTKKKCFTALSTVGKFQSSVN